MFAVCNAGVPLAELELESLFLAGDAGITNREACSCTSGRIELL